MTDRQKYIALIILECVILIIITVAGSLSVHKKKQMYNTVDTNIMISETLDQQLK